jgi:prepilin-type N-terminal cleavage/methylation domain-containing protein
MNKQQQGFSVIELLLVVVVVGLITAVGWAVYNNRHNSKQNAPLTQTYPLAQTSSASHSQVNIATDKFLISKVGTDNFKKYYMFDQSKTNYANPKESKYDFIAYHFRPVKAFGDDVIMVQVNRNDLKEVYADSVPDCIENSSFCNFNVNKQEAVQIAKQHSLTANDLSISWGPAANIKRAKGLGFVIKASTCSQNKSLIIDYRNGSVLWAETGCGAID